MRKGEKQGKHTGKKTKAHLMTKELNGALGNSPS